MANQLELRSTFQLSAEGAGTINVPSEPSFYRENYNSLSTNKPPELEQITKKNNFAVATTISQAVINGLGEELRGAMGSYSSKKLASLVNKNFDTTAKHLSLSDIRDHIVGFDFNADNAFDKGVENKFYVKRGQHTGHVILHIPPFVPQTDLDVPKDATNFKICARLIAVSDFVRSGTDFHTQNVGQHGKSFHYESTMLPLLRITTQPLTTQLRIHNPGFTPVGISSVCVIAIRFFSYSNKRFTELTASSRMKICEVF